jgi:hypothetical protein
MKSESTPAAIFRTKKGKDDSTPVKTIKVIAYEVVLESGERFRCSADNNSSLLNMVAGWWNDFGIVTKYPMNVFKQGPFWRKKVLYYPPSLFGQINVFVH